MSTIILIAVFFYLLFQSISDIKTMQVYVLPNNIAVILSVILYIIDCMVLNIFPSPENIITIGCIFLLSMLKMYGIGDAKAMTVIYLTLRYKSLSYPNPDTFTFLLSILIANVLFLTVNKIYQKIKRLPKSKKAAYFPFLTIGYMAGLFI